MSQRNAPGTIATTRQPHQGNASPVVAMRNNSAAAGGVRQPGRFSAAVCRCCEARGLDPVLDLGDMPLTAAFVPAGRDGEPEERFPLEVAFCPRCSLVQVLETVAREKVFHSDYPYYSSFSEALLSHAHAYVNAVRARYNPGPGSLVVELASNDGYLLKNFVAAGVPVLGVDPSPGPAKAAEQIGVPTLCEFFDLAVARRIAETRGKADVIIANNVMAHVEDLQGFIAGIAALLKPGGVLVTESPYVKDLIENVEFDTIYHEHLCYYSLTAIDHLFRRHGLYLNDVEFNQLHGGSFRLHVGNVEAVTETARQLLTRERDEGMTTIGYYRDFARRVAHVRERMLDLLGRAKAEGKTVAAYGAAAKGIILLNYLGVGPETVAYCVDRNVHKHGKFLPGLRIPVFGVEKLVDDVPDYCIVLAWNFKDEIMKQQAAYKAEGGRFIVPIPEPVVV